MRTVRTRNLLLTWPALVSEYAFTVPQDLIGNVKPEESIRFHIKQSILRNDFPTIGPGRNTFTVDGVDRVMPTSSPSIIALVNELSLQSPLEWSFETYLSVLVVTNSSETDSYVLNSGSLAPVFGIPPGDIVLAPGDVYVAPNRVELAPPEILVIRSSLAAATSIEVRGDDDAHTTSILAVIANTATPRATFSYVDQYGLFEQTTGAGVSRIELQLTDVRGAPLVCYSAITLVMEFNIQVDDEGENLRLQRELLEIQRLKLLRG